MRPSGQTGFTRLRSEVRDRTHDSFVDLLHELFAELVPGFTAARRLGELDRKKVDLFVLDDTSGGIELAVQAKGFEKPFGVSQMQQCLKEIAAYASSGEPAAHYVLAVNKRIPSTSRIELDLELAKLVAVGKVKRAELLDETRLLARLKELALNQLERWSKDSLAQFRAELEQRLAVVAYIREVPFGPHAKVDPAEEIVRALSAFREAFPTGAFGRDVSPPRFLVTSSFGFGKTSTLQAIGADWANAGGRPIYAPAALLSDEAFHNGAGLANAILDIIKPEGVELSDVGYFLLRETLRTEVATAPGWILLLDGIDESPNWHHHRKLGKLWMSSADMALPLVASVRDEVYESRVQEFQDGGGKALNLDFFKRVELQEWPDPLVLRFLNAFAANRRDSVGPVFGRLRTLVEQGGYQEVYGDIPKRPLFLGMLAIDAWNGREPDAELHLLYNGYVRQKLAHDRYSAAGVVVRDGQAQARLGEAEYVERMLLAMQDLAGAIVIAGAGDADTAVADETCLMASVLNRLGEAPRFEELLLNSLLAPAGRDPATRQRLVRFAHQSFFDWFSARWSLSQPDGSPMTALSPAAMAFAEKMAAPI